MVIGWVLWPIILIVTCTLHSLPRLVRHWRVPLLTGVAAFPLDFLFLNVVAHVGPTKFDTMDNVASWAFLVRWWGRWRFFGPAQLLSDRWITHHQPYPTDNEVLIAFAHVSLAASITVATLMVGLVFLYAIGETLMVKTEPFGGGRP